MGALRRCLLTSLIVRERTAYLNAERTATPWGREQLFQCTTCRDTFDRDHAQRVTSDEMHETSSTHGGCPICHTIAWAPAGWRRVPPT